MIAQAMPMFQTWQIGAAAAAVAIPALLILYFLKLRRRDLEVSSTLLWKKSIQDMQANAPFQKLRRNLLLLIQLLALAAMLLAVAQPEQRANEGQSNRNIVLIDRSSSMSALDAKDAEGNVISRLERAKLDAIAFIESLRDGGILSGGAADQAMVVAFDSGAEIIQTLTDNKALLIDAVRGIQPTDAATVIDEAARIAASFERTVTITIPGETATATQRLPGPPIHLFSDGGIEPVEDLTLHPETQVVFHGVGEARTVNVGITALRAERTFDKTDEVAVFVGLQSTDTAARSVDVQIEVDGLVAGAKSVTIPAAEAPADVKEPVKPGIGGVVFKLTRPERALLTVRAITKDALAADNSSQLVLPPAKRLGVALVGGSNALLREAIEGLPLSKFDILTPQQYETLVSTGRAGEYDVYVLDGWAPSAPKEGETPTLAPGRYLAFNAIPPIEGLARKSAPSGDSAQVILTWEREHPAMRLSGLDALVMDKSSESLLIPEGTRVLATSSAGPAIVEASTPEARCIVVSFDPMQSTWPLQMGFPLFIGASIRSLAEDASDVAGGSQSPGGTLSTRVPAGITEVELVNPDKSRVTLRPSSDGRVSFGPARRCGLYTLTWAGAPGAQDAELSGGRVARVIAVNMNNPAESAVESLPTVTLGGGQISSTNTAGMAKVAGVRKLWPWLLAGAVVVLLLEWFIYHRRVQI